MSKEMNNTVEMTTEATPNTTEVMNTELNSEIIPEAVPAECDVNVAACGASGLLGAVIGFGIAKLMGGNPEKTEAKKQKAEAKQKAKEEKKAKKKEKRDEFWSEVGKRMGYEVKPTPVEQEDKDNPDKETDKK